LFSLPCVAIALVVVALPAVGDVISPVLSFVSLRCDPFPFRRNERTAVDMPTLLVLSHRYDAIRSALDVNAATLACQMFTFESELCSLAFRDGASEPSFGALQGCFGLDTPELDVLRGPQAVVGRKRCVSFVQQPVVLVSESLTLVGQILSFGRELLTLVCQSLTFIGCGVPQVRTVLGGVPLWIPISHGNQHPEVWSRGHRG
jgi:hypothetical protein